MFCVGWAKGSWVQRKSPRTENSQKRPKTSNEIAEKTVGKSNKVWMRKKVGKSR